MSGGAVSRLMRFVGTFVVPEDDLSKLVGFVADVLRRCDVATMCDFREDRVGGFTVFKTLHDAVVDVCLGDREYLIVLDLYNRRSKIYVLAASAEVDDA